MICWNLSKTEFVNNHSMIYDILQIFQIERNQKWTNSMAQHILYTLTIRDEFGYFPPWKIVEFTWMRKAKMSRKWKIISLCILFSRMKIIKTIVIRLLIFIFHFNAYNSTEIAFCKPLFTWRCIYSCWWMHQINTFFIWLIIAEKGC